MTDMPFEAKRNEKRQVLKGRQIPKPPPSDCQGYCGVCGKTAQEDGFTPILLATFTHADGKPISVCARDWKWWKIREGTRVRRLDAGGVRQDSDGGSG